MKKATVFVTATCGLLSLSSAIAQTTVFNDTFGSGSTVNSASPGTPTSSSASYEIISSKSYSATPTISSGNLNFGIVSSSSGGAEAQALFSSPSPITLHTLGDYIELNVVFTGSSDILNNSIKTLVMEGLFNSSQVNPIAGGLNGTANNSSGNTGSATGGAQNWVGYAGQIGYDGANSAGLTRAAQTPGTGFNQNQDVIVGGGLSSGNGYDNPAPTTINSTTGLSTGITVGSQYTESLLLTLVAGGDVSVQESLYSGSGTGGTLLSQSTGTDSSELETSFDALAFGYYLKAAPGVNTTFNVNQVDVIDDIQPVPEPSTMALAGIGLGLLGLVRFRRR